jgi:hypothetical protein
MHRSKNPDPPRSPAPGGSGRTPYLDGSWLAGAMIGATIMTLATGAIMLGTSLAMNGGRRAPR